MLISLLFLSQYIIGAVLLVFAIVWLVYHKTGEVINRHKRRHINKKLSEFVAERNARQ